MTEETEPKPAMKLRGLVDVRYVEPKTMPPRIKIVRKGEVVPDGVLSDEDVKHMLRGKLIEEVDEATLKAEQEAAEAKVAAKPPESESEMEAKAEE